MWGVGAGGVLGGVPVASRGANAGGAVWALGRVPAGCGVLARARAAEALEMTSTGLKALAGAEAEAVPARVVARRITLAAVAAADSR